MPGFLFFSVFLMSQICFSKCEYLLDISFTYRAAAQSTLIKRTRYQHLGTRASNTWSSMSRNECLPVTTCCVWPWDPCEESAKIG